MYGINEKFPGRNFIPPTVPELLLNEGLFGKHGGHAVGSLFALREIEQVVLLDPSQLVE